MLLPLICFHKNIEITTEIEKDNNFPFLDVLIITKSGKIGSKVCRKEPCTYMYMNWYSSAPKS